MTTQNSSSNPLDILIDGAESALDGINGTLDTVETTAVKGLQGGQQVAHDTLSAALRDAKAVLDGALGQAKRAVTKG